MDTILIIALIVVGIVSGILLGYFYAKGKTDILQAKFDMLSESNKDTNDQLSNLVSRMESLTDEKNDIARLRDITEQKCNSLNELLGKTVDDKEKEIARLKSTHLSEIQTAKDDFERQRRDMEIHYEKALNDKQEACDALIKAQERRHNDAVEAMQTRFNETMDKVTAQISSATEDMLKKRQKEFADTSNQNIGQIITPLKETIDRMKQAMNDTTVTQTAISSEMKANIENMMRQSQAAKESADELARVFKHTSKVQGDWGEAVLDELLQAQGLTKGIHYDTQTVIKDASGNTVHSESGSLLRPDVILHLDQRRELIIDSKVSLTAFMDYANAETEEDRQRYLKSHISSIQKHVDELSKKDYSAYIQFPKVKMDYVIMFVPHTGALWTALNEQPDLWRKSMDRNVFIADEQTLFAALRIINLTWTQIIQAQNHQRVYDLANEMLKRIGQFWSEYQKIGKALDGARKAFDDGEKKITDHGTSINTTANQLIRLGARQNDKYPLPELLDVDSIPGLEDSIETD